MIFSAEEYEKEYEVMAIKRRAKWRKFRMHWKAMRNAALVSVMNAGAQRSSSNRKRKLTVACRSYYPQREEYMHVWRKYFGVTLTESFEITRGISDLESPEEAKPVL